MSYGLKGIKTIRDFELNEKNVFLRLDLNVPIENGIITDQTRLLASLPTINYALSKGAKLILASHLGRPKSSEDKKYSLEPVAKKLSELLNKEVILVEEPTSEAVKPLLIALKPNQLLLLENIRFEPGETENSEAFAQVLAQNTEIYINDAFGASHRAHASIEALPKLISKKGIGFLIEKEIQMLDQLISSPKKPFYAILGGAKVSDKIEVIEKLIDLVDGFLIGGAMAYTFLKAKNLAVGKSLVEVEKLNYAREMIKRMEMREKTLLLPVDHIITDNISSAAGEYCSTQSIPENKIAVDIGHVTIKNFSAVIKNANTVFWNGPMGIFEKKEFSQGTFSIAKALAESSAVKIVGGGDSAAAAEQSGYAEKMTHISTGGGASLEYIQGDALPGLEVLRQKIR